MFFFEWILNLKDHQINRHKSVYSVLIASLIPYVLLTNPLRTALTWQREGELNTEDSLDSVNKLITNQGLGEWFIIGYYPG